MGTPADLQDQPAWCVYVLRCSDGSLYTGITNHIRKRLAAHQAGKGSRFVRARRPFVVARVVGCTDGREARTLEYRLKRLSRQQKEKLLGLSETTLCDPGGGASLEPDRTARDVMALVNRL